MKNNSYPTTDHPFLGHGGEMGALIRAKDWGNTALGDPSGWPQSLRTMVSVMLDNPFGMYIAWGTDFIQIYNDAYRPILGLTKHPQALGISSRETFSEIWDTIGPMFHDVMEGKPVGFPDFKLEMNRNGYLETCYFDFSYSPIRKEDGKVGGVLVTVIETTHKKRGIEDLKESEERFRTMAEGTDVLIAVGDESSNATYFNKAWVELTGRPMEELLEFGWLDLVHPDDRERYVNVYLSAFEKRIPFTGEFRVLNSKGEYRWLLAQGPPRFRPDGSFAGYISSSIDITSRKLTEQELEESKNQLQFAIDAAKMGTFDYNPETGRFKANDRLKAWFGLNLSGQVELSDALQKVSEKDRERVSKAISRALDYESGGEYDVEFTIINPLTLKEIHVHAKGRAWFDENKKAYRLNGTIEDVTESVIARRTTEEMERNLRNMIARSPIGICLLDADTMVSEIVNDKFLEISHRTSEAIIGKYYWDAFPEVRGAYEAAMNSVVENGAPFYANEIEWSFTQNSKQKTVYVTFVYAPLKNAEDKVIKVAVWVIENTQQVMARQKIEESESQLQFAIDAAEMATFDINPVTKKLTANRRFKDWFGLSTHKEPAFDDAVQSIIEKDRDRVLAEIAKVMKFENGGNYEVEYSIINPINKIERVLRAKGKTQFDENKEPYRFNGTLQDITVYRSAAEKIRRSEENLRLIIQQAPISIAILKSQDFVVEIINSISLEILGKQEHEVLNRPIFEAMPELVPQGIKALMDGVFTTGKRFSASEMQVQLIRNGREETVYISLSYEPLYNKQGEIDGIMSIGYDVTEQVTTRQKVEESEQSIRALVDSAPFPIGVYVGEEMRISLANQSIMDVWGKGNDVVGKLYSDILPELENQAIFQQLDTVFNTGVPFHARNQRVDLVIGKEMKSFYFNYSFTPLLDANGEVYGVMNTAADVTELNEAKQKIERALTDIKMFKFMADTAADPFIVMKEDGSFAYLNNQAVEKWGYTPEEIKNLRVPDVDPVYNFQKFNDSFALAQKESLPRFESLHKNKKGKVYPVEISMGGLQINDKPYMFAIARDITERKKAEQDLVDAFQIIEENEKRFRKLADSMPQNIWTNDADGKLTYSNRSFQTYSGFSAENIINEGLARIVHPDDLAENLRIWKQSLVSGKDFLFEHRFRRFDGEYRWHLSRAVAQRDDEGNIRMWVGSSTDIQDIKEQDQQKDYFISLASHELKTPVTSIKGYVQILLSMYGESGDKVLLNSLQVVDKQIIRLTNLISELLDISKIKTGGLEFTREKFEMSELVMETTEEIRLINPGHDIKVKIKGSAIVFADRSRIGQVIINFLTNAVKYAPSSTDIIVECSSNANEVKLSVQDFGIGISTTDQDRIFERFYRVEGRNEKTYPGFGIGLFISSEIIQRHQGSIRVESRPGEGSVFSFTLPTAGEIDLNEKITA